MRPDDLSALAWVQDELRRSLEAAHKALRRHLREAEAQGGSDVAAIDPSVLRGARSQLHQGVGALELVGLPAAAVLLRASEALVQRFVAKPHKLTAAIVEQVEHASFALLDYMSRLLAGKPVSPLSLFPQYRAVQEAAGAERLHPADLWEHDWQWRQLPGDASAAPRQPDSASRGAVEQQILAMMRAPQPQAAAARMSELCAGLGAGAPALQVATVWKLAAAVFEALAHGLLPFDVYTKRVGSQLLALLRALERGGSDVSPRLAQDLLFFCAQAGEPGGAAVAPRLAAVREAYGLAQPPVDYTHSPLGRFDPAWIVQARKRVAAAKESWSAVAGGESHRIAALSEQFSLVGDSLRRLFPQGEALAEPLQQAVARMHAATGAAAAAPPAELAMEVATSLLYLEAALEDVDFDATEQADRVHRLAQRLGAVLADQPAEPLEGWMEELYRRVSDRQTMGSVVQELRASLSESEKLIDEFFRNPAQRSVLIPVPNQLSAMRGVLSVLGMDHAAQALLRMRDEVDGLASTEIEPQRVAQAGVFDRLAGNLGALGFLIDMLSVQPQLAKSLFTFDAETGTLAPVMGRAAPPRGAPPAAMAAAAEPVAPPPPVEPALLEQAQMLAFTSVLPDVPLQDVERDLERLSTQARAADQATLSATVQHAREALQAAHDDASVAAARGDLSEALVDFVASVSEPVGLLPEAPAVAAVAPVVVAAPVLPPASAGPNDLDDDAEMREIFLEEAREVLQTATAARAELALAPSDLTLLTTLRRAFHTLKGSSRMVGLTEFGEAAWVCEQRYNAQLAGSPAADEPLLGFTAWAIDALSEWVDDIAERRPAGHDAATVQAALARFTAGQDAAAPPASDPLSFEFDLGDTPAAEEASDAHRADDALLPTEPMPLELADAHLGASFDAAFDAPFDGSDGAAAPLGDAGEATVLPDEAFDLLSLDFGLPPVAEAAAPPAPAAEPVNLPPMEDAGEAAEAVAAVDAADAVDAVDADPWGGGPDTEFLVDELDVPPVSDSAWADLPALPAAPVPEPAPAAEDPAPEPAFHEPEGDVKIVGPLRIGIPLFNIYLNEADELSRRLTTELAEWALELHRPLGETPVALAHSLAGSSATVGFTELSQLARSLEHAQMRSQAIGQGTAEEARLFVDVAEEIRRLLHQFAAGFLKSPKPELLDRLAEHELSSARRFEAATEAAELAPPSESAALSEPATAPIALLSLDGMADVPDLVMDTDPAALDALKSPQPPTAIAEPAPAAETADAATRFGVLDAPQLQPLQPLPAVAAEAAVAGPDGIDSVDAVDPELFPIFEEECQDLLPQLAGRLREWARNPGELAHAAAAMRTLHTLKGGARLAGAMRLGDMAHRLETRIERLTAHPPAPAAEVEQLQGRCDLLSQAFEALRARDAQAYADAVAEAEQAMDGASLPQPAPSIELASAVTPEADAAPSQAGDTEAAAPHTDAPGAAPHAVAEAGDAPAIDWSRFVGAAAQPRAAAAERQPSAAAASAVRVRVPLLDRMVNQAGEVSITRSRIETQLAQIKGSLADLTENLDRLRGQLRDIEFQGETQMTSRLEAAKAASQSFDPLEFDRFTRFQELTRMMAESVNDVATVQRTLHRSLDAAEDELAAQSRLTRDLQDDLLRTRMVEFDGLSERLYRVVRQAAKETGKQVRLDIVGGQIEVDRGVLDRMTPAFEHLLRNSVAHGIEAPERRTTAGKDATGSIFVTLSQEGNEVGVEFRDDGAGLDLARIRDKGVALGLLAADAQPSEAELANLIFAPGFSTADAVTELAGRGIGMDVVRSDVIAMGGRVETATAPAQGTSFKLILPLTTAVTQVVMLRAGSSTVAVPSTLVELVKRATPDEVAAAYQSGQYALGERSLPFFWLGALLQSSPLSLEDGGRTRSVVVVRSAQRSIAIHVDEVLGNQEAVVKNLGPQLARLPGLAGMTLLASGAVALIYNPVALAALYGETARRHTLAALQAPQAVGHAVADNDEPQAPLVLVVDDSLTVRRVTQRLLLREGYRVALAKDGLDALERLAEERPRLVLSDIEMPRMDGFDLVRQLRGEARFRELPVIMITSRIAQKHREYAAELGVDHYLGKPYAEEDLLALVARYTAAVAPP